MLATIGRALKRLPQPLVPFLPMLVTVLGPGLLLWVVAFHIPVNYPQETMAPYPHGLTANMLPGHGEAPAQAVASAPTDTWRHPGTRPR